MSRTGKLTIFWGNSLVKWLSNLLLFATLATLVSLPASAMLRQPSFPDISVLAESENNCGPFCRNDPVNNSDPLGLETLSQFERRARMAYYIIQSFSALAGKSPTETYSAFRSRFLENTLREGYTIYSDDFSQVLHLPPKGVKVREAALLVLGSNESSRDSGKYDPQFFFRASQEFRNQLQGQGLDVNVLMFCASDQSADLVSINEQKIKNALRILGELKGLGIYGHHYADLNLTANFVLNAEKQRELFSQGRYAKGSPAWYFACFAGDVQPSTGISDAQQLADITGMNVMSVKPDYSVKLLMGGRVSASYTPDSVTLGRIIHMLWSRLASRFSTSHGLQEYKPTIPQPEN